MSSNSMSSGSGTNPGDITANSANPTNTADPTNTAALNTRTYNASKINEFHEPAFNAPTTFGTPLCIVFRWDIACG